MYMLRVSDRFAFQLIEWRLHVSIEHLTEYSCIQNSSLDASRLIQYLRSPVLADAHSTIKSLTDLFMYSSRLSFLNIFKRLVPVTLPA